MRSSVQYSNSRAITRIYDARATIPFDGGTYRRQIEADIHALKQTGVKSDSYICDVGCGLGWHLDALADLGFNHLYGIDLSDMSLREFASRSGAVRSGIIQLVHGDARKWRTAAFFDVATSFLSCIGEYSPTGDLAYLRAMRRIVRRGGFIVVSCITRDDAHFLEGRKTSRYSKGSEVVVTSNVEINRRTWCMTIVQSVTGKQSPPPERIHLYSIRELVKLARQAGFQIDKTIPANSGASTRFTMIGRVT